ncbi:MAG: hypothetical protein A2504_01705 [Bdellovibrionales bacterium RIFOXYD12_FULL_39_22]|nr:MAG: hypothetical protein A2385_04230 [Bdellovibrionales bacterium RIFOXYB1_FULL_39_21]OFZ42379.1 MAG: hypothetical protein A2485_15265 [Bdellovibrionales bacterium RIFOXYC12_FULL_39_17]OFZ46320.1 MAG: hypothetical protein A2404_13750 [Bdellovibrionales bacterium RIFOXYC1_FULL_39_130]OFZ75213.1 MAG: hypothetical protein A2560_15805 [Bdellovibrionales bacterium RIFOXYD1_FULL_39_84]OFZ93207.1 MAG: hypothetical protein A2504_01705 [Bdellovibrionales bacterium RIFOXYD12_FULL_39_22]HLE11082.1 re
MGLSEEIIKKRVLVVDDAVHMAVSATAMLKRLGIFNIDHAENGMAAWAKLQEGLERNNEYGLVISDLHMPEMSGLDLLKKIRADDLLRRIPFIIFTSESNKRDIFELLNNGANNYIVKPGSAEEFEQKIGQIFTALAQKKNDYEDQDNEDTREIALQVINANYDLLENIISSVNDFILVVDAVGKITKINNSLCEALATDAGRLVGRNIADFCWEGVSLPDVLTKDELRGSFISQTGEKIPAFINIKRVKKVSGQLEHIIITAKDFRNDLALQKKLNYASQMAGLGEMAAGISHEVNNPLAIIMGNIRLIRKMVASEKLDQEKAIARLGVIESSIMRISKILEGLKTFAQDSNSEERSVNNLYEIIDDVKLFCQQRFENHHIPLICGSHGADDRIDLFCKKVAIEQVLLSLLNNAFAAVADLEDKWIKIGITVSSTWVEIFVVDSGKGIDKQYVDKIFNPFFTGRPVGEGIGLGLSVAKGIVEEHGGMLVYMLDEENTTFKVSLPKIMKA